MESFVKPFSRSYRGQPMSEPVVQPLAPRADTGRTFGGRRKVRLGDVGVDGRLRFDALTRYTQDVSDDDTTDAGLDVDPGWVVRSTVVDELAPAQLGEWLSFETFCSGLGGRWAERRLTVRGDDGAHYEVATLWVCIDAVSGRPHRLTDHFNDLYAEAAAGRKVSARLTLPPPPEVAAGRTVSWPLRRADFDVYGHVNNAAYWSAVEEWLSPWSGPRRARLEYGGGLDSDRVEIQVEQHDGDDGSSLALWWLAPGAEAEPVASALVVGADGLSYP